MMPLGAKANPKRGFVVMTLLFGLCAFAFGNPAGSYPIDKHELSCDISFPQAAANLNTIYIPFTLVGHLMIVEAQADGRKGNFIVDTGSERLLLNKEYLPELLPGKPITAIGNTGILSGTEEHVDSLYLDQLYITDLIAHVVDLNHIEIKKNTKVLGILGYNVFRQFELFIDSPNARIVLSRVDKNGKRLDPALPWEIPYDSMSFVLKKHLIVLNTMVNGVRLEMILDSGAELNLIDHKVNRKVLDHFTVIKRVNLIGAGKKQVEVLAGVLNEVKCGNQSTKRMNTLLTSLLEINTSFGINVQGVLGYEFLSKRRTLINYQKQKIYFYGSNRS